MKKFYLLGLLGVAVTSAFAQQAPSQIKPTTPSQALQVKNPTVDVVFPSPVLNTPDNAKYSVTRFEKAAVETNSKVGTTFVINQTNFSPYRRVVAYADGKVSVTWTASTDNGQNGFLSRGSGYNHFDGSAWSTPSENANGLKIEQNRAGFPCMITTPDNKEIVISHRVDTSGKSGGLLLNQNEGIGSTTFSTTTAFQPAAGVPSVLWPRAVVAGNYMYVIANYTDSSREQPTYVVKSGVKSPMVFSRYNFTNSSWDMSEVMLPGYDSTLLNEGSNDNYAIDAKDNKVVIVTGGIFNSLVFWKSEDNGANWTHTIIDSFPVDYEFDKDTLMPARQVNNGSLSIILDANNKAHVFSGLAQVSDSIMGDGSYIFTFTRAIGGINDAILHWSEATPDSALKTIATTPPTAAGDSAIGTNSFETDNRYGISNATWPSSGIDATGRLFVTFSGLVPVDLTGGQASFRDVFVIHSEDNGATWSTPVNLTSYLGFNREEVYPMMARNVTDKVHLSYLNKSLPGNNVPANNTEVFDIYYLGIPVDQIMNNTVSVKEIANDLFTIDQNFPNPFNGVTSIPVKLTRNSDVSISVVNMVGQLVYTQSVKNVTAGVNTFDVSLNNAKPGIYFYTVEAGGFKSTRKMIVQ